MRDNVKAFVTLAAECLPMSGPVYEFGSYLVEGQEGLGNLRRVFHDREFVGCDMRAGPGVDRVEDLGGLTLADNSVPSIVCVDTLEHVFEVRRAVDEMVRVLAPGGIILLSAPMDFRVHNYPSDYWRITPACMAQLLAPMAATVVGWQGMDCFPHTVLGIGCKAPVSAQAVAGLNAFIERYQQWLRQAEQSVAWAKRCKQALVGWTRSKGERRRIREYHRAQFMLHAPAHVGLRSDRNSDGRPAELTGTRLDLV